MSESTAKSISKKPKPTRKASHSDESVKETFESIVIAFILAFVFRSYVVEAFVIPTGSMAPTLLGEHIHAQCESCGYIFNFDPPDKSRYGVVGGNSVRSGIITAPNEVYKEQLVISCPMCHYPYFAKPGRKVVAGDRILVQKYLYDVPGMGPRRWDVVVFKAPHKPEDNYIKRLVGLPNEAIQIIDGNVFVAPIKADNTIDHSTWRIARKVDAQENPHADTIQRAVWQPVYHSQYIPQDIVDSANGRGDGERNLGKDFQWQSPWVATTGNWTGLSKADAAGNAATISRHYQFDGEGNGRIEFRFDRVVSGGQWLYFYNAVKGLDPNNYANDRSMFRSQPYIERRIEDLRIAASITPAGDGCAAAITTQARIPDEAGNLTLTNLRGEITAEGNARLIAERDSGPAIVAEVDGQGSLLKANTTRSLELWFVDQELSLWIDGRRVVTHRFDPTVSAALQAVAMKQAPRASIEVSGCAATLRNVEVDRDIYYTVPRDPFGSPIYPRRGIVIRNGQLPSEHNAFHIYNDQFFCMGDNSPNSTDSRSWDMTVEWIRQRKFQNAADRIQDGVVPRRLMMGRAFFVYFPGPHGRSESGRHLIPNFGDMRFIR